MSVYITTYVWQHSQHRGTALLLMLALADQANDEGVCWPSMATLAHKTRLSERTLQNLLPVVLDSGEVIVLRETRGGHTPRVYQVLAPAPEARAERPRRAAKSAPPPANRGEEPAPVAGVKAGASRGAESAPGVQISEPGAKVTTPRGEARCTLTVINRKEEPSIEPETTPRARAGEAAAASANNTHTSRLEKKTTTTKPAPQPERFEPSEQARIDQAGTILTPIGLNADPRFWRKVLDTYGGFDLEIEAMKIADWLQRHRKRACSRQFVLNWLDNTGKDKRGTTRNSAQVGGDDGRFAVFRKYG